MPSSEAEYAVYADSRQNLAVAAGVAAAARSRSPDASGWTFGLHPAMPELAALFKRGRAAVVANVGPLLAADYAGAVSGPLGCAAAAALLA